MRLPVPIHFLPPLLFLLQSTPSPFSTSNLVHAAPADPKSPTPALWPEPTTLSFGNAVLWLDRDVEVVYARTETGTGGSEKDTGEKQGVGVGEVESVGEKVEVEVGDGDKDAKDKCVCHGACGCGCGCIAPGGGDAVDDGNKGGTDVESGTVTVPIDSESNSAPSSTSTDDSETSSTITVTEVVLTTSTARVSLSAPTPDPASPSASGTTAPAPISVQMLTVGSLPVSEPATAAVEEEGKAVEKKKEKERDKFDPHIGRNRHGYGVRRIKGHAKPGAVPLSVPVAIKKRSVGQDEKDMKSAGEQRIRRGGDYDRGNRRGLPQSRFMEVDGDGDVRPAAAVSTDQVPLQDRRVRRGDDPDRNRPENRDEKNEVRPAAVVTMNQVQEELGSYRFNFRDSAKEAIRDRFRRIARWLRRLFQKTPSWRDGLRPMNTSDDIPGVEQIIYGAIARAKQQMLSTNFVPWKFYPRHTNFEPDVSARSDSNVIRKITILENANDYDDIRDYIDGDESYRITISETGEVEIQTSSRVGTLRALQSLPQLFYAHSSGSVYMPFAPVYLADGPKWKHRGLNLDIARNAFWPDDVKRTIDGMASVKLNRLHVHATDSQSWPIEVPSIPELSAKGSYCAGCVWTAKDLRDVQIYGLERGVSVFLEIDIPGHTASIGHAFPELVVAFEHGRWEKYAQEPPSGQISLNNTAVDGFLDRLLDDVVPRVAPFTKYFHTGGDEFNANTYLLDPNVESNDPAVLMPLVQQVVQRVHGKIREAGLTPIVWEEMVLDWNLTFPGSPEQPIVQSWRDTLAVKDLLQRGHRIIFGASDAWYLDCGVGGFFNPRENINVSSVATINLNVHDNETDPDVVRATVMDTRVQDPFLDWCSPVKNWRHMYVHNPLQGISEDLAANVVGGEAHMWTEMVDGVSLDGMVWPRTAAVAEVLWGGPRMVRSTGRLEEGVKLRDATRRLGEWRERAVLDLGVQASVVSMVWCLMGGNCDV